MAKPPRLTAKEIIALLRERGFVEARQTGSHKVFYHPDGRRTVVPSHGNKILHPKLTKNIFKEARIEETDI
ncbi:MAG: type II toxin-antitoxin system HicA family toxin [Candidatus Doudnabacteria bacterium]|nr:type II toxin-antitoxin system HicA family toxin [bacterium]MDZ4244077.1 type II toxin-antitoxin system HicA family toxin [Candidatus Doudnabacteria bacterium]